MKSTSTIRTVGDVRDEKRFADAIEDYNNSLRARIEREKQQYIQARLREYPQIGTLNSGKFYAYVGGYTERHYVESFFLSRVIDVINDAR